MRIEDERRCAPAELGEPIVDGPIAELVIGRIHDVAGVSLNAVGERTTRVSERLGTNSKSANHRLAWRHQGQRRTRGEGFDRYREKRLLKESVQPSQAEHVPRLVPRWSLSSPL